LREMLSAIMITLPSIIVELLPFVILYTFCLELISKSVKDINLKLHRWIDLIAEECSAQE
jgi:hypothetical protein